MYKRILFICLMTILIATQSVFATSNSINDDFCAYLTDDQDNTVNLDIIITQDKIGTRNGNVSAPPTNEESLTAQVALSPYLLSRENLSDIQEANTTASTRGSLNDGAWDSTENVYVETTIFFDKKIKNNKSYYKLTKVSYNLTNHNYDGRIQIVSQNMSMYCRGPQSVLHMLLRSNEIPAPGT